MDGDALADRDERANHKEVPAMTQPPTSSEAADLMGVGPRDLLASGFADALAPADAAALHDWLGARLDALRDCDGEERQERRRSRWSGPLPGSPMSGPGSPPEIA